MTNSLMVAQRHLVQSEQSRGTTDCRERTDVLKHLAASMVNLQSSEDSHNARRFTNFSWNQCNNVVIPWLHSGDKPQSTMDPE
jgi:endonuclease I